MSKYHFQISLKKVQTVQQDQKGFFYQETSSAEVHNFLKSPCWTDVFQRDLATWQISNSEKGS